MPRNDKRVKVTLACEQCKRRNYITMKNKLNDRERIEMKKYCRWDRVHTLHKETRKQVGRGPPVPRRLARADTVMGVQVTPAGPTRSDPLVPRTAGRAGCRRPRR